MNLVDYFKERIKILEQDLELHKKMLEQLPKVNLPSVWDPELSKEQRKWITKTSSTKTSWKNSILE